MIYVHHVGCMMIVVQGRRDLLDTKDVSYQLLKLRPLE